MKSKKIFTLLFLSHTLIIFSDATHDENATIQERTTQAKISSEESYEKIENKITTSPNKKITSLSLEAILKRMEERSVTRSGAESTFIQLLALLQELLGQLKEVNNSLKEVAITTATAGVAAKLASDQLDLLLGE